MPLSNPMNVLTLVQPRFIHEVSIVPFNDGFIIDGGRTPIVFRGSRVKELFARVLPLLDGTRSLDNIVATLRDIPSLQLHEFITCLWNQGLIEEMLAIDDISLQRSPHTLAFLRRYKVGSRAGWNSTEAARSLSKSAILIVCDCQSTYTAAILRALLSDAGVEFVEIIAASELSEYMIDRLPVGLVVSLSVGSENAHLQGQLDGWCRRNKLTWLRTVSDNELQLVEIGPYFTPDESCCYACFRAMHQFRSMMSQRDGEVAAWRSSCWLSLVATEILYCITGIGRPYTMRGFTILDLQSWSSTKLYVSPIPGCSQCRPEASEQYPAGRLLTDTALVYEDSIGLATREAAGHGKQVATSMARAKGLGGKRFSSCSQTFLPLQIRDLNGHALGLRGHAAGERGEFTLECLSTMLRVTAGHRPSMIPGASITRWTATAGNLGSVEIFVAVRGVSLLESGIYYYNPISHSLARVEQRAGGLDVSTFIARAIRRDKKYLPDVLFIFTGAYHRLEAKYGAFSYKLLHLDAGVAANQLHLLCCDMQIYWDIQSAWADDLIEQQLNLEPFDELCTAIVALSARKCSKVLEGDDEVYSKRTQSSRSRKRPEAFAGMPSAGIVRMLCSDSRLTESDLPLAGHLDVVSSQRKKRDQLRVALPRHDAPGETLGAALGLRRSIRRFDSRPPSLIQISTMLRFASSADSLEWGWWANSVDIITFVVLARRVGDLTTGVYEYDSADHYLTLKCEIPAWPDYCRLFVQEEFAVAPAVVWIVGNLDWACSAVGAHGHRLLLLRAGAAANSLSTAAIAVGLAGSIVAGLVPGAARRTLSLDGFSRLSLAAFAFGIAHDPEMGGNNSGQ